MLNYLLGAATIAILWLLVNTANKKGMHMTWWNWLLTVLALAFTAFALASVSSLVTENAPKAALVIGGIFGLIAVVAWVLLGRFVFLPKR